MRGPGATEAPTESKRAPGCAAELAERLERAVTDGVSLLTSARFILAQLEDPPDGLAELRAVLVNTSISGGSAKGSNRSPNRPDRVLVSEVGQSDAARDASFQAHVPPRSSRAPHSALPLG